jgi:hypothetical protein
MDSYGISGAGLEHDHRRKAINACMRFHGVAKTTKPQVKVLVPDSTKSIVSNTS